MSLHFQVRWDCPELIVLFPFNSYEKALRSLIQRHRAFRSLPGRDESSLDAIPSVNYVAMVDHLIDAHLLSSVRVPSNRLKAIPQYDSLATMLDTRMRQKEESITQKLDLVGWDVDGETLLKAIAGDAPIEQVSKVPFPRFYGGA